MVLEVTWPGGAVVTRPLLPGEMNSVVEVPHPGRGEDRVLAGDTQVSSTVLPDLLPPPRETPPKRPGFSDGSQRPHRSVHLENSIGFNLIPLSLRFKGDQ